uniref:HMG box domain-containing protein n=1 Tax=Knipowitschia caucasica TaxID=637954 RepID=A0AAV2K2Q9_KNICA
MNPSEEALDAMVALVEAQLLHSDGPASPDLLSELHGSPAPASTPESQTDNSEQSTLERSPATTREVSHRPLGPAPRKTFYPAQRPPYSRMAHASPQDRATSSQPSLPLYMMIPGPKLVPVPSTGPTRHCPAMIHGPAMFQAKQPVFYTSQATAGNVPSRKRKRDADDAGRPYIKKPLNAFMIYRAEQRGAIMQELGITNSAEVNTILGERWGELSEAEQAPYYEKARVLKREHQAKYPDWSPKDNSIVNLSATANLHPMVILQSMADPQCMVHPLYVSTPRPVWITWSTRTHLVSR